MHCDLRELELIDRQAPTTLDSQLVIWGVSYYFQNPSYVRLVTNSSEQGASREQAAAVASVAVASAAAAAEEEEICGGSDIGVRMIVLNIAEVTHLLLAVTICRFPQAGATESIFELKQPYLSTKAVPNHAPFLRISGSLLQRNTCPRQPLTPFSIYRPFKLARMEQQSVLFPRRLHRQNGQATV